MIKEDLLKNYNQMDYRNACEEAYKDAVVVHTEQGEDKSFNSMIPHEINSDLWDLKINNADKINLFFELYEEMPCYGHLMYLCMAFKNDFNDDEKEIVLLKFKEYLKSDNEHFKTPIGYSLWCDYFEDIEVCELVWKRLLLNDESNVNLLKAVLSISGPVPWRLKTDLYSKLLTNSEWHNAIYQSILFSAFDVYGSVDRKEAMLILSRLEIDKTKKEFKENDFKMLLNKLKS